MSSISTAAQDGHVQQGFFEAPTGREAVTLRKLQRERKRLLAGGGSGRRPAPSHAPKDMWPELEQQEAQRIARDDERRIAAARARLQRIRREIEARTRWHETPYAERLAVVLNALQGQGEHCEGVRACIISGLETAIEQGKLDEQRVAHIERVAREALAHVGAGCRLQPLQWPQVSIGDLLGGCPQLGALHPVLLQAVVDKINAIGPELAALGYDRPWRVNSASPWPARNVAGRLREIWSCLEHVVQSRETAAKGHKRHNADNLLAFEKHASELLGVRTTDYPIICMP